MGFFQRGGGASSWVGGAWGEVRVCLREWRRSSFGEERGKCFFSSFFEDGTNQQHRAVEQSSSAVHLFKDVDRAGSNT